MKSKMSLIGYLAKMVLLSVMVMLFAKGMTVNVAAQDVILEQEKLTSKPDPNNQDTSKAVEGIQITDGEGLVQWFDENFTGSLDMYGNPLPKAIQSEQIPEGKVLIQKFDENFVGSFDHYGNPLPRVVIGE
ncbi:MAG: hypothetical protein HY283_02620 [Nitrospirae bacterium]|nr:hypothetical protein [Nitrospirota bacterium]